MKYRMLAIDLDGTLLDSQGRVPAENLQAINRAKQHGMLVALCTGRGLTESRAIITALDHHGPVVLAGGSHVSDPLTNRTLHRAIIEPGLAQEIIDQLDPKTHAVVALLDPGIEPHDYLIVGQENLNEYTLWWFETIGARLRCVDRPSFEDLHHVLRVGIVAPEHYMAPAQQSVETAFGSRVFVQHFHAVKHKDEQIEVLEVFASGVNKWAGLQWLCAEHGIASHEVAAIGDQINDISMIEAAGCGIAMGNAVPSVKKIAKHITARNDEAGVAQAVDNLLTGHW